MAIGDIDFTPPAGVRDEAERGLEWRREYGRGGTEVGVARARDLSNGKSISPDTAKRMKAYFDRHEIDKQGQGWKPGQDGFPSAGRIAWALWGGDPGRAWANKLVRQIDAATDRSMTMERERRESQLPLTIETRGEGKSYITGYAAKYNVRSTLLGNFREEIKPGAFDRALREQSHPIVALWNHDSNQVLGSTRSGTLSVDTDDAGMRYSVEIPDTTLGRDLSVLIGRGDVWGSSFAFTIASRDGESWAEEDGQAVRYVHEVEGVYDVSPVLSPAYEDATASVVMRSYERFLQSHRPALKLPALARDAKTEAALRSFLQKHGRSIG